MSNNIEGKVVVITGASSGLGEAAARHLCAQGASVVLGARRADRIRSLAGELTGRGGKGLAMVTDVTHCDQVKSLAARTALVHRSSVYRTCAAPLCIGKDATRIGGGRGRISQSETARD